MSDEKQSETIAPHEYAARMQPIVDRCARKVGVLALLGDDGRLRGKGTVFFTQKDHRRFVCTARHVVREKREGVDSSQWPFTSSRLRVMVFNRDADLRAETIPTGFDLEQEDLAWEDARLDVAVFNAPSELVSSGVTDFSAAKEDARVAKKVRDRWQIPNTETLSLATFVVGFPNVTHRVDPSTRIEWLGLVPMTGYITALDRDSYDGHAPKAPQMMVELDPGTATAAMPKRFRPVVRDWKELLLAPVPEDQRPPLGGFSGAPLFLAHQHGEAIIGVMKEGTPQFQARILAVMSCWDDVLNVMDRDGIEA